MKEKFEERSCVTFENESQKLFGIIHRPIGKEKCPAILFCHGFEGNKCGKNRLYVRLAQELTKLGFVVLRFDYRGAGDSEGEFHEITLENEISDTLKALSLLSGDEQVDKARISLFGRSLGGVIATLAGARFDSIKSMVLWAPVFSGGFWKELWEASEKHSMNQHQALEVSRMKHQIPNQTFLKEFFNLDIAKDLKNLNYVPLLLIHSEKDSTVRIDQSELYEKARETASAKTSFLRLSDTEHDFSHAEDQKIAIKETCDWFHQTAL